MAGKIESKVRETVGPVIDGMGYELVDIEYNKIGDAPAELIIYIDKEGGVTLDDTETVSRAIDGPMDEADPIEGQYMLCVSSPGIDRPFSREKDFLNNIGGKVDVRLYKKLDGQKELTGVLEAFDENSVTVSISGETKILERQLIAVIRAHIDF